MATVLIVDDDVAIRESLKAILGGSGHSVTEAETGEAGLSEFDASSPDIVFVDLMMESVDAGIQFCKGVRAKNSTTPIFLLSSIASELTENVDHLALGIKGVFDKPFKPEKILEAVENAAG
ncbi:MAG: response regulator transcription factor [Planctomycetota bacterium]|jgi:DNA-binding response OmpR family regulator